MLGAVGEPDPQPLALAAAQGRARDAAVVCPGLELDPGRDLDLLVLGDQLPLAQHPPARQPPRLAVVEVAQHLGWVEAVGPWSTCRPGAKLACVGAAVRPHARGPIAVARRAASPGGRRARGAGPCGIVSCSRARPAWPSRRREQLRRLNFLFVRHNRNFDISKDRSKLSTRHAENRPVDRRGDSADGRAGRAVPRPARGGAASSTAPSAECSLVTGPRRAPSSSGPAHQRRRGPGSRARAATRPCSTARATCRPTCGSCGWARGDLAGHRARRARARRCDTCGCTASAARSRSTTPRSAWAVTSLIGPGAAEAAGTAPLPAEHAQRVFERQGVEVPRGRHRPRARPDHPRRAGERAARACWRSPAPPRSRRRPPRSCASSRGARASAARCPARRSPGGGDRWARRQLHQGLLHRPGDGRPPALQGQAQPPPARASTRGAGLRVTR